MIKGHGPLGPKGDKGTVLVPLIPDVPDGTGEQSGVIFVSCGT